MFLFNLVQKIKPTILFINFIYFTPKLMYTKQFLVVTLLIRILLHPLVELSNATMRSELLQSSYYTYATKIKMTTTKKKKLHYRPVRTV